MGIKTRIDWCDSTWNPVTGCLHGCEYCYARRIAERFSAESKDKTYFGEWKNCFNDRPKEIENPVCVDGKISPYPFGFAPTFHRYRLDEPARWKKPRNIFVCSMADLFGEWVPDEWIREVFAACEAAPQHRYLFLTKNPKRLMKMYAARRFQKLVSKHPDAEMDDSIKGVIPMPEHDNWWFGSTLTSKGMGFAQGSIHDHNFISIEPLMEPLDVGLGSFGSAEWIILGAETGNRKDKVVPKREWVDNIVEAASITHMKVFMKESLRDLMGDDFRQEFPWEVK